MEICNYGSIDSLFPHEVRFSKPIIIPGGGAVRSIFLTEERFNEYTVNALISGVSVEQYVRTALFGEE